MKFISFFKSNLNFQSKIDFTNNHNQNSDLGNFVFQATLTGSIRL